MQPTTVTNKNVANGVSAKKRAGKPSDDGSDPAAPVELQNLLQALRAMRAGDFSVRMTGEEDGLLGKIADTFNDIVAANQRMAERQKLIISHHDRETDFAERKLPLP